MAMEKGEVFFLLPPFLAGGISYVMSVRDILISYVHFP